MIRNEIIALLLSLGFIALMLLRLRRSKVSPPARIKMTKDDMKATNERKASDPDRSSKWVNVFAYPLFTDEPGRVNCNKIGEIDVNWWSGHYGMFHTEDDLMSYSIHDYSAESCYDEVKNFYFFPFQGEEAIFLATKRTVEEMRPFPWFRAVGDEYE